MRVTHEIARAGGSRQGSAALLPALYLPEATLYPNPAGVSGAYRAIGSVPALQLVDLGVDVGRLQHPSSQLSGGIKQGGAEGGGRGRVDGWAVAACTCLEVVGVVEQLEELSRLVLVLVGAGVGVGNALPSVENIPGGCRRWGGIRVSTTGV